MYRFDCEILLKLYGALVEQWVAAATNFLYVIFHKMTYNVNITVEKQGKISYNFFSSLIPSYRQAYKVGTDK